MFVKFTEALVEGHVNFFSCEPRKYVEKRKFFDPCISTRAVYVQGCWTDGERWKRAWEWGVKKPMLNRRKEIADGSSRSKEWV